MNVLYFTLLSIFWGGSFLAINFALKSFSPFLGASLRILTAMAFTLIYLKIKGYKKPEKSIAWQAIGTGVFGLGIPWGLLFWAEQFVSPGLCSIMNATSPIFTALFAAIIIGTPSEKMTWNKWLGLLLGFLGISVIFAPQILAKAVYSIEGLAALLIMSISYGISTAWLKKISDQIHIGYAMLMEFIGGLAILIPVTIIYGNFITSYNPDDLWLSIFGILYLGIFSTALAFVLYFTLIRKVGAVQAAAVTYLIPIISIMLDWLVLDKWIGEQALFGGLIVFAALRLIHRPSIQVCR